MPRAGQISLGGYNFDLVPGTVPQETVVDIQPEVLVEGDPRYTVLGQGNSIVAWGDLSGGLGPVFYSAPNRYLYTLNVDCSYPGYAFLSLATQAGTITGLTTTPSLIRQFKPGGPMFLAAGTKLWRSTDGQSWGSAVLTTTNAISGLGELNGVYVACAGASEFAWRSTDGGLTWAQWTSATPTATAGKPIGLVTSVTATGTAIAAGYFGDSAVRTCSDLSSLTPSWGNVTVIGSSTTAITGMTLFSGLLFVLKEDGAYLVDLPSGTAKVIDQGAYGTLDSTSPGVLATWIPGNAVYFQRGTQVYKFNGWTLTNTSSLVPIQQVGYEWGRETDSELTGVFTCLLPTERALYAVLKTVHATPRYHVLKYDERPGPTWHTVNYLGTAACNALALFRPASMTSNPLLVLGADSGVQYIVQPAGTVHPLADQSGLLRYVNQGAIFLPKHWGRVLSNPKYGLNAYVSFQQVNNAQGISITPQYQLHTASGEGTVQSLGTAVSSGAAMPFPNTNSRNSQYEHLHPIVELRSADATTTPVLLGYAYEYVQRGQKLKFHTFDLAINTAPSLAGARGANWIWNQFDTWLGTVAPLAYVDPNGALHYVLVENFSRVLGDFVDGSRPTWRMPVKLKFLNWNLPPTTSYWDDGRSTWNDSRSTWA